MWLPCGMIGGNPMMTRFDRWRVASLASIAASITLVMIWQRATYWTFDSLDLLTRQELHPVHSGYQLLLGLAEWVVGPRYNRIQVLQALLIGACNFASSYLLLRRYGSSLAGIAASLVAISFLGGASRYYTVLEDYALSGAILGLAAILLWPSFDGSRRCQVLGFGLISIALFLNPTGLSIAGPFLLVLIARSGKTDLRWRAPLALVCVAPPILTAVVLRMLTPGFYSMFGGNGLSLDGLRDHAIASARFVLYAVRPTIETWGWPWAFGLAAVAAAGAALWLRGLFRPPRGGDPDRDVLLAMAAGLIAMYLFSYWWDPGNLEQMIGPCAMFAWALTARSARCAHIDPCHGMRFRRALFGSLLAAGANILAVVLPCERITQPYLAAIEALTNDHDERSCILTTDLHWKLVLRGDRYLGRDLSGHTLPVADCDPRSTPDACLHEGMGLLRERCRLFVVIEDANHRPDNVASTVASSLGCVRSVKLGGFDARTDCGGATADR